MDELERAKLRLECLKLAMQMEGKTANATNVMICANHFFDWLFTKRDLPVRQPEPPKKEAGKK
jgi:hypothetical protein